MNSIDSHRTSHRLGPARAGRLVLGLVGRSVALSAALLLAACGSSSSGDRSTALSNPELARAAAPIEDDVSTLTADEVAAAAAFYGRNTVSIIVGSGAGGGFDTTARLVARHIGRHIPGTPTAIVVNMPGGGGLVAANHVFNAAPKDGSVIGLFHEAQVMNQLTGAEGVQFDLLTFNWLGSSYDDPNVCIVRSDAPVTAFQDLIGRADPIAIGGTAPGSNSYDAPRVLAEATGANLRDGCWVLDHKRREGGDRAGRGSGHVSWVGIGFRRHRPNGWKTDTRRSSCRTEPRGIGICHTCRWPSSSPRTRKAESCCGCWTRPAQWRSRSPCRRAWTKVACG